MRYGQVPSAFAAEAYDAMITLAESVGECGKDTSCIHEWYTSREYNGALGTVQFDEVADAKYGFVFKKIQDGKFAVYDVELVEKK